MALIGKHLTLFTAAVTVFGGGTFEKFLPEVWLEKNFLNYHTTVIGYYKCVLVDKYFPTLPDNIGKTQLNATQRLVMYRGRKVGFSGT